MTEVDKIRSRVIGESISILRDSLGEMDNDEFRVFLIKQGKIRELILFNKHVDEESVDVLRR